MNACTEPKSVGLALQLDYFCFGTLPDPFVKSFVNVDVDNFWIVPHTELISFPPGVEWYCGNCNASFYRISPGPCSRCQSIPRSNIQSGQISLRHVTFRHPSIKMPASQSFFIYISPK